VLDEFNGYGCLGQKITKIEEDCKIVDGCMVYTNDDTAFRQIQEDRDYAYQSQFKLDEYTTNTANSALFMNLNKYKELETKKNVEDNEEYQTLLKRGNILTKAMRTILENYKTLSQSYVREMKTSYENLEREPDNEKLEECYINWEELQEYKKLGNKISALLNDYKKIDKSIESISANDDIKQPLLNTINKIENDNNLQRFIGNIRLCSNISL